MFVLAVVRHFEGGGSYRRLIAVPLQKSLVVRVEKNITIGGILPQSGDENRFLPF
jgi:hypothetical protein